jgi:hypothetical protein
VTEHSDAVRRVWADQRRWSTVANRLKSRIDRARRVGLWLGILAAASAVAAVQVDDDVSWLGRALSAIAAISAGISAGLIRSRTSTAAIRDWTRARSASEGLKSEVYQRLAGSSEYTGTEPDQQLADTARQILDDVSDLAPQLLTVTADDRPPPAVSDLGSYIALRVDDQIDGYYRPRAVTYQRRVNRLRLLGDGLGVVAVVFAGVAAAFDVSGLAAWVPVITTITAAVVAHVAASRYDHQIIEFVRTADRLQDLRDNRRGRLTVHAFVDACEDVISVENQGWMARWNSPSGTTS